MHVRQAPRFEDPGSPSTKKIKGEEFFVTIIRSWIPENSLICAENCAREKISFKYFLRHRIYVYEFVKRERDGEKINKLEPFNFFFER